MEAVEKDDEIEDLSEFLLKLKNYLYQFYSPADSPIDADFHLTTSEVYNKLFVVFPFPLSYNQSDIAKFLHDGGYKFADFGDMRFEWLFKKNLYI